MVIFSFPKPPSKSSLGQMLPISFMLCLMVVACGRSGGSSEIAASDNGSAGFTLSGTVTGPANAAVDWDVNDSDASNSDDSNNSLEATQPLSNPVSLAGHVKLAGDESDFFSVSLSKGQAISLYVADPDNADLNLYLYDDTGEISDIAMGDGFVEVLEIDAADDYIVEVRIVDSGEEVSDQAQSSNYNLVISTTSEAAVYSSGMRLSDDFVPGEVIVQFIDGLYATADSDSSQNDDRARSLGMEMAGGAAGRSMLMQFNPQTETAAVYSSLGMSDDAMKKSAAIADTRRRAKHRTLEVVKALRQREDVLFAEPNYTRRIFATPNDPFYKLQWHYDQIHLPGAWDLTNGSSDVIVAVVDGGVLINHPDLAGKLTGTGYDFIRDETTSGDGDGIDANPDDPGDQARDDNSSTFHGTHVAGTIGAATGNDTGVAGAGWLTRVMAVRCLGIDGLGTDYDLSQGIRYAAGLENDSGTLPDDPADIINLSLGSEENSSVLSAAIQAARGEGVIVIAAAGNEATDRPLYPASNDGVISVSAVDYAANLAIYSSYGSTIDVAAPGGDSTADLNYDGYGDGVVSTFGSDTTGSITMEYGIYQGTSMAAPHVSAVVALMKAVRPEMTPDELDAFLASGQITTDIGDADYFGAGLIDAQKAVLAAQEGDVPTLLSVNPSLISLGVALSGATITAELVGDTDGDLTLSIEDISTDASWLSIDSGTVDANGLGEYTITADRNGLADGVYNGTITFPSNQNTVTTTVTMLVSTVQSNTPASYYYIRLVNADTDVTAYETVAEESDGVYPFSFLDVSQGDYYLYAGTDLDLDLDIQDVGEIVGAYPDLDQPQIFTVDSNLSGLDFISQFNIEAFTQTP
ncbi:MAG: S8 family serine peptidase [Desulfobacteraceae bacterium]|jgi:serine protease